MEIKEEKQKSKFALDNVNSWKVATIVLGLLCIVLICYNFVDFEAKRNQLISNEALCNKISSTPSWADQDGNIVGVGYVSVGVSSKEFVDRLIAEKIFFIYNPGCGWCEKQIEEFGSDWQTYIDSGLTVKCGS